MRYPKTVKTLGFSLIQMAMLVAVFGIILASILPGGELASEAGKQAITKQHMEAIEKAMQAFMATKLRRPCPADGTLATTVANFGIEAAYPGICIGSSPAANFSDLQAATGTWLTTAKTITSLSTLTGIRVGSVISGTGIPANTFVASIDSSTQVTLDKTPTIAGAGSVIRFSTVAAGVVPVKSLGLPEEYALDGYGRRIMYIVDKRATRAYSTSDVTGGTTPALSIAPKSCFDLQTQGLVGAIDIFNDDSNPANDTIDTKAKDHVMWALVSYGKAGHGAFPASGSTVAGRIDASDNTASTIPDAGQINAFISMATVFTTSFLGRLVREDPDNDTPYNTTVWYSEETKNTCCVGKMCGLGFDFKPSGAGGTADNYNGISVATGDVNGDGITDLVMGVGEYAANSRVYVVFGRKTGWPMALGAATANIISDVDSATDGFYGFYIQNRSAITNFAKTIAVGDVNQDGYDDVIINGSQIVIIFGHDTFTTNKIPTNVLTGLYTTPVAGGSGTYGMLISYGAPAVSQSVAVGDLKGDGFKSIIFSGGSATDKVWVIYDMPAGSGAGQWASFGSAAPKTWNIATDALFTGTYGFRFNTTDATEYPIGHGLFSLASGDINGDTADDIIIGDYSADYTAGPVTDAGKVYALLTPSGGWSTVTGVGILATIDAKARATGGADVGSTLTVDASGSNTGLGLTVATADMNNDGYKDIITSTAKNLYIFYGKAGGSWAASTLGADVTIDTFTYRPASISTGTTNFPAIIKTGDINGDGKQDLLFSTYETNPTNCGKGANTGSTYVIFQPSAGWSEPNNQQLFKTTASSTCDATELDMTYYDDANINCHAADGTIAAGTPALCGFRIDGKSAGDYAYIPAVGDLNADGKNDIFIAAPGNSTPIGRAYCILGRKTVPWDDVFDLNTITLQ
jgi:hypothetical protein